MFCLTSRVTHPKVKAVEGGVEVIPSSEAVHLQSHLRQKQPQKHKLRRVCLAQLQMKQ